MNKLTNGIKAVQKACEKKGYTFRVIGGDGVNTASSIFINGFEIRTGSYSYDNEDMDMLSEIITDYDMKTIKEVFCDKSMTYANNGMYVKDSYKQGKLSLADVVNTAVKGSMYSQDMLESVKKEYIKQDISVNSAFLYKGMYCTPYMAITILQDILNNNISKQYLLEFMAIYMNKKADKLSKKDVQNISEYLFQEYFNGNTVLLNEIDMHAVV